jgi:hypothetical protein
VSRSFWLVIALTLALAAGFFLGETRGRSRSADFAARANASARDAEQLRNERDALVAELAESRLDAAEQRTKSDEERRELDAKLDRFEGLVAALVGTRQHGAVSPTPMRSPEDEEVIDRK